jgi:hypothetical protein
MKTIYFTACLFSFIFVFAAFNGCEPQTSSANSKTHNAGNSCMECHKKVQVCGTLFSGSKASDFTNVKVKFLTSPDKNGTEKAALEVDKSGNFYTINKIDYKGTYPIVEYSDGKETQYMKSSIISGDCNLCHQEGDKIWIE